MASGWNLWVRLAGSWCGWNLWVWLVVVVVRRYIYIFPNNTYPYSSCICSFFAAASLLFVHLKNIFIYIDRVVIDFVRF